MESWEKVFKKCDWKCVYCGAKLAEEFRLYQSSCEDHLVPKTEKENGRDDKANLVAACHTCNSFKRDWVPTDCPLIQADKNKKRYVGENAQPEYIIKVIENIIKKAEDHLKDHLNHVPEISRDPFKKSANEYITALKARQNFLGYTKTTATDHRQ
jgi:hypothetical protein